MYYFISILFLFIIIVLTIIKCNKSVDEMNSLGPVRSTEVNNYYI